MNSDSKNKNVKLVKNKGSSFEIIADTASTRYSIAGALLAKYQSDKGVKNDAVTISEINEAMKTVFLTTEPALIMAFIKAFKSLPYLGTSAEIDFQEAANQSQSKFVGGAAIQDSRKDLVAKYKQFCVKANSTPAILSLTYKGTWTQFGQTEIAEELFAAFKDEILDPFPKSKELIYGKFWFTRMPTDSAMNVINYRQAAAILLLKRFNNGKFLVKSVKVGDKTPNGGTYSTACLAWDKDLSEEFQPANEGRLDLSFPTNDWPSSSLLKAAAFPDWRFMLQKITKKTTGEDSAAIQEDTVKGIYKLASIYNFQPLLKFNGSMVNIVNKSADNTFVDEYYGMLKYLRASLRNLARAANSSGSDPIKKGIQIKFE